MTNESNQQILPPYSVADGQIVRGDKFVSAVEAVEHLNQFSRDLAFIMVDRNNLIEREERLMEALQEIVRLHEEGHAEVFSDAAYDYAEIARGALRLPINPR